MHTLSSWCGTRWGVARTSTQGCTYFCKSIQNGGADMGCQVDMHTLLMHVHMGWLGQAQGHTGVWIFPHKYMKGWGKPWEVSGHVQMYRIVLCWNGSHKLSRIHFLTFITIYKQFIHCTNILIVSWIPTGCWEVLYNFIFLVLRVVLGVFCALWVIIWGSAILDWIVVTVEQFIIFLPHL